MSSCLVGLLVLFVVADFDKQNEYVISFLIVFHLLCATAGLTNDENTLFTYRVFSGVG